jgi:hypothetical protein
MYILGVHNATVPESLESLISLPLYMEGQEQATRGKSTNEPESDAKVLISKGYASLSVHAALFFPLVHRSRGMWR